MNIIEAFNAVKAGKRVRYVLSGREVVVDVLGNLCWRNSGRTVMTHTYTCEDDAFEVIEPVWREATVREAFAALAEGKTIGNDRDMLGFSYRFSDDDVLVNRHGGPVDVWSNDFEPGVKWYILEDD